MGAFLEKNINLAEKRSQIFGRRFVGFDGPKKAVPFSISKRALEYMTAMEAAPQLKASGLDGDYRILADFGGTVLAGSPSKYGVQFVTWDWDYDRTGVVHGHYFMENYDAAKRDFATRSGLVQKEQLFSPEQLTEIFRCCADSVDEDFFELTSASRRVPTVTVSSDCRKRWGWMMKPSMSWTAAWILRNTVRTASKTTV